MKIIEKRPGCVKQTLAILGDKWTALILLELNKSPLTFTELELILNKISPRTLSQRINKLEQELIITPIKYCNHPPRFRYQLTQKGNELHGVLSQMAKWGSKYYTK